MHLDNKYHRDWQRARLQFILEKYPAEFWKDKTVLELGSFNGVIGNFFRELGSKVLCIEGREENIIRIKEEFPELEVVQANLDTPDWEFGNWDVIINFGLFYHLEKFHRENLTNCIKNSKLLFFETVIYDSYDCELYERQESGLDQSLSEIGKSPSTRYVENILDQTNTYYTKYSETRLGGGAHYYDWKDENSKIFNQYNRRFWIICPNQLNKETKSNI